MGTIFARDSASSGSGTLSRPFVKMALPLRYEGLPICSARSQAASMGAGSWEWWRRVAVGRVVRGAESGGVVREGAGMDQPERLEERRDPGGQFENLPDAQGCKDPAFGDLDPTFGRGFLSCPIQPGRQ